MHVYLFHPFVPSISVRRSFQHGDFTSISNTICSWLTSNITTPSNAATATTATAATTTTKTPTTQKVHHPTEDSMLFDGSQDGAPEVVDLKTLHHVIVDQDNHHKTINQKALHLRAEVIDS